MQRASVLFIIALFLQGCAYAISPGMADKADTTISFEALQADPDSFQGALLILGGTIVQTSPVGRRTLIEIDQKQLDYWGKPQRTRLTGGRFFAFAPGYLNSMVYAPGIEITIAGEVLGVRSPMLGNKQYDHPVVLVKELKRWERGSGSRDKASWMDPLNNPTSSGRPE